MKLTAYLICFFMMCNVTAQKKVLFLVAGQSNAVGQGDSSTSTKCIDGAAYEYRLTGDLLTPLKDPVGAYELHLEKANKGSAWPAFAKTYHALTGKEVIIVPAARGGSSCSYKAELDNYGTWDEKGRLPLFDSAIIKVKAAMNKAGITIDGVLWSQGERDANAINAQQLSAEEYQSTMEALIYKFRKVLGKDIKFYIIQTGYYLNHPVKGFDEVRTAQQNIAQKIKDVYIVYNQTGSFEKKGWMKDEIHYNQTALNDIGTEIAKQVILKEQQ